MNEAELRGINLDELETERFTHPNHFAMLKKHHDQVFRHDLMRRIRQLQHDLEQHEKATVKKVERIKTDPAPKQLRKKTRSYIFTEIQLRIAEESLARHAEQKSTNQNL